MLLTVCPTGNSPFTTNYDPEIVDFSPNFTQIFDEQFNCEASSLHEWTEWYDIDNPNGTSDTELLNALVIWLGGHPCSMSAPTSVGSGNIDHIDDIECREVGTNIEYNDYTFDSNVAYHYCEKDIGFKCENSNPGVHVCPDFKVRYCCYIGEHGV